MKALAVFLSTAISMLAAAPAFPGVRPAHDPGGERTQTVEYLAPNTGETFPVVGYENFAMCGTGIAIGCAELQAVEGEGMVSVEIADATGQRVFGYIYQDRNDDGISDTGKQGPFCGRTPRPVPISPKFPIYVFPGAHSWSLAKCDAPGLATTGSITVTFHPGKPARSGRPFDEPPS